MFLIIINKDKTFQLGVELVTVHFYVPKIELQEQYIKIKSVCNI